jgi:hypothetical protein
MLPEKTPVKLIMNWNIQYGKDQEYFEFVMREWVPATTRLGLRVLGAWFSVYAHDPSQPRIMAEAHAEDLPTMRAVLRSDEWKQIHERLMEYVEDYSQKVVYVNGDFQL